ncbi:MAG: hypothetical protein A2381_03900 [Bdellovibrionales bacterium RIFOXYB1_FULL_37_110]|nr:MAG: hypothetical protein A2417_10010 [Bdellovibrionales bacterium RIFOXYC1_FULL_37_79]OFZ59069.1 MAG: hypothetical protein A2381_03900 [Bdellovibrionales bacterium RIFOXYB1_FULL_37_110]OFZ64076.1 MAG: hypothetical protein A2577_15020 [Bdellovibrionales bacterium RIFOXYD1_FULL_36_51]
MLSESGLIDKFQKIEALFLGATTLGEKTAAAIAMANIQNRLDNYKKEEPATEWSFKFGNHFEKKLFKALLTKYNLTSYRYKGQRYTTVMVLTTHSFVNKILWPQYLEMCKILRSHLNDVTDDVIKKTFGQEETEDEIREEVAQISYQ